MKQCFRLAYFSGFFNSEINFSVAFCQPTTVRGYTFPEALANSVVVSKKKCTSGELI